MYINPIPAGEGGGPREPPPPIIFEQNSKSIGLRLFKFVDYIYSSHWILTSYSSLESL